MPKKAERTIQPIGASFDEVADAMLGHNSEKSIKTATPNYASLIRELTLPKSWSVLVADIFQRGEARLDAEHYDPFVIENDERLRDLGFELAPLSDFATVTLPGMFTRIWAQDKQHGVPYINATDLMSYFALGTPAQERFLSYASDVDIDKLIIREGMILVTCSGTIGRIFDTPKALDGCAGTHDILRVQPHNPEDRGFLRTYLTTDLAQIQILRHTHGGQIDHVTDTQVSSCLVPVIPQKLLRKISELADKADALRAEGLALLSKAAGDLHKELNHDH